MKISLVMSMRFIFSDDWNEALLFITNFRVFIHAYQPATADVFPVVANMHIKLKKTSIQKQIVKYDIKSKYPEEYSTVDKVRTFRV